MLNSNEFSCYAKRFRAIVAAMILMTLFGPGGGPLFPPAIRAQTFSDSGFTAEVVTTLPQFLPVGVTWASDGRMFIWQRNGVIRIYKNGQLLPTPFLDISANVNTFDDRGMLGLALHPNFAVNGYVYVIYVREDGGNPNDPSPKIERLSRFIANAQNPDVALPNSETILMTISTDFHHHENGTLRFGSDGRLFVGHGEDATADGANGNAFVAQNLNDPRGKILRITEDGNAPGDNPFDDGTNSIKSKVYSYGLRNPYRFTLHPVSGEPYLGDVGWNTWEEFDRGRGKNFGWPCYEGVNTQPEYQNAFPTQCAPLTSGVVTAPLISYPHPGTPGAAGAPFVGSTAIGGPFYTATLYPEVYRNTWFITDYAQGWIRRMIFDQNGDMTGTVPFATGLSGPVDLELGPDGMLYYVEIITGRVVRIRYNGPSAMAAVTPSSGYSPLTVNFSSTGSSSPNGTPLAYLWEFGDGQTSNAANPSHTYVAATVQTFTAKLTVTTNTNQSSSASIKVTVGSLPPTATIQSPINGTGVLPGQTIVYQGSANDPDNGTIPSTGLAWTILLHHNDHVHTQLFTTGSTGSATIQYHGIGTYSYEFRLTATDSSGLTHTTSVTLPVLSDTTPPSDPSGPVATPTGSSQINLTWTASTDNSGSTGYLVERCQGLGCTNFVQIASISTNSYTDTGLTPGTTYNYRIRAMDSSGNQSLNSTSISATTGGGGGGTSLVTALGMNEGNGTTLADASGTGHAGTLVNGPLWVASQATYGQAVSLDGSNDAVSIANPNTYNFGTADFTIELWIKRNALGGGQRHLFSKCAATTWAVGCKELYFNDNNQLTFGSFSTGDVFAGTIADTNWHHIAMTFTDSTNTLRMYVDGALITTATRALEADGATHVVTLGNMHGSNPFSGLLDELRIYNRVLTLAEIQTDRTTPIAP
jgi:glucose/arabinose dehydrogenase/chitodextrinase